MLEEQAKVAYLIHEEYLGWKENLILDLFSSE